MLTGGCHCRAVRYEATGEVFEAALCHCTDCRGVSGAPALAWATVKRSSFRYTQGEPVAYQSSPEAMREFCGACGTQLTFRARDYGDRIDIATGSLDDPDAAPPREHIFTRSRLSWMTSLDALPDRAEDR